MASVEVDVTTLSLLLSKNEAAFSFARNEHAAPSRNAGQAPLPPIASTGFFEKRASAVESCPCSRGK